MARSRFGAFSPLRGQSMVGRAASARPAGRGKMVAAPVEFLRGRGQTRVEAGNNACRGCVMPRDVTCPVQSGESLAVYAGLVHRASRS